MLKRLGRFSGVFALIWTVGGGYVLVRFGFALASRYPRSEATILSVMLLAWFSVGLLLAITGLTRGTLLARFCATSALGMYLLTAEPVQELCWGVVNLFRTNEYAGLPRGAPECSIFVSTMNGKEIATLAKTVKQFAKEQSIHQCRQKYYLSFSSKLPRPHYKGDHVCNLC